VGAAVPRATFIGEGLKVAARNLLTLKIADSDALQPSERVVAIAPSGVR